MTSLPVKFLCIPAIHLHQRYSENEYNISLNTVCLLKNTVRVSNDSGPLFVGAASYLFLLYPNTRGFVARDCDLSPGWPVQKLGPLR